MTVPVAFGLKGDFRDKKNFRMVLESPEGIIINSESPGNVKMSAVEIGGRKYVRHEFFHGSKSTYFSAMVLFASSEIKENAEGLSLHYYAKWDGGEQLKETLPVNIVRITGAPKLKRILVGLELSNRRHVELYPNLIESFRKAGLNYLGGGISSWTLGTGKYLGKGAYADLIEPLKKSGIEVSTGNIGLPYCEGGRIWDNLYGTYEAAGTLYYPDGEFVEAGEFKDFDVEDTKAVNLGGNRINQICPSYRGRWYKKVMDNVRVLIDYGYKTLLYDEETWSKGREICYCARCKSRFKDFLKESRPDLKYIDPQEFASAPDSHREIYGAWWDFKYMLVQEIYRDIKNTAVEHGGKEVKVWAYVCADVGEDGLGQGRLTNYARLAIPLDGMLPMVYTDNAYDNKRAGDIAAVLWKHSAGNAKPMMALSPARTYEFERIAYGGFPPAESIKYQIMEGVSQGVTGFTVWAPASALEGALSYKHIADAVRIIYPAEDIIDGGVQIAGLSTTNRRVHVRGMEHNGRAVILAAEYSASHVATRIEYKVQKPKTVTDLETREVIARITPEDYAFEVVLDKERARLFLVE